MPSKTTIKRGNLHKFHLFIVKNSRKSNKLKYFTQYQYSK